MNGIYDALLIYLDPNSYSTHDPVWETSVIIFIQHESLLKIELKLIKHKAIETWEKSFSQKSLNLCSFSLVKKI